MDVSNQTGLHLTKINPHHCLRQCHHSGTQECQEMHTLQNEYYNIFKLLLTVLLTPDALFYTRRRLHKYWNTVLYDN